MQLHPDSPNQEDSGKRQQLKKRGYVYFPADLNYVGSTGTGRFVTRVEHRMPDGTPVVWTSRRHRKTRGLKIGKEVEKKLGPPHDRKRAIGARYLYWGYRPRAFSWWVAFLFTIGSVFFMIGAVPEMFPSVSGSNDLDIYVKVSFFIGSLFFTGAGYVQFLEVINVNLDMSIELKDKGLFKSGQATPQSSFQEKGFSWFGWQPDRLSFWASSTLSVGTVIFNINCFFAIFSGFSWVSEDILVWTPSTIASALFITASYVAIMEVSHGYWSWNFRQISWWVTVFSLLGSIGFFASSLFGVFGQGPIHIDQEWSTKFILLIGCIFFLLSSYLMVPEMLNKQTETEDIGST